MGTGRTNGQTDKQKNRRQTVERPDGVTDRQTDGQMYRQTDRWPDGQTD